ncbi:MAG: YbaK/EbsC family protein [Candidatus Diapherotrites archaeon]|uniref:YbaK/EbsC family protein n=1 Tax=Candidatus Iainarchaeum sp. TaxID=3101447 RepID=A0A8T3YLY1_9ARCH|nr:YbaK/EbsC family protein [Candidatus Diapherotrites archaeon]
MESENAADVGWLFMEIIETPLMRMLYAKEIEHRVIIHKKPAYSCEDVSRERNIPVADILKCILVADKWHKHCLFCLPGDCALDLEKARAFLGTTRLSFATREEAEAVTGQKPGTINPFFHTVKVPIVFDKSILSKTAMDISSGNPNAGVQMQAQMLVLLVNPKFADVLASMPEVKNTWK